MPVTRTVTPIPCLSKDGVEVTDGPYAKVVGKFGGKLFKVPQGYVTQFGDGERVWPDLAHVENYLNNTFEVAKKNAAAEATAQRIVRTSEMKAPSDAESKKAYEAARAIPVRNIGSEIRLYSALRDAPEGGEQAPSLIRKTSFAKAPKSIARQFIRQHAVLMRMGEPGRWLANHAKIFSEAWNDISDQLYQRLSPALDMMRKNGVTADMIDNRTAPEWALKAWDEIVAPTINEVEDAAGELGVDFEKSGGKVVPRYHAVKPEDIDAAMIKQAKNYGILDEGDKNAAENLAAALNNPDLGEALSRASTLSRSERLARLQWLRKVSTGLAHHLEAMRGDPGPANDLGAGIANWSRTASRRLAEAASFGPNLERLHEAYEHIPNQSDVGMASKIMDDVRGKLYIPESNFEKTANGLIRFWLSTSGPRHTYQAILPIMRFGWTRSVASALRMVTHDLWSGDLKWAKQNGITMPLVAREIDETPSAMFMEHEAAAPKNLTKWATTNGLAKASKIVGDVGTLGLHVFLNAGRLFASNIARHAFPDYLEKALAGDRDAQAVLAETFKVGDPTTAGGRASFAQWLKSQDTDQLSRLFQKMTADWEGMTYNPEDFPMMARSQLGRQLTRFRIFRWNLAHNIWNEMTSPNFSKSRRMMTMIRFLGGTGLIGTLDPMLRHMNTEEDQGSGFNPVHAAESVLGLGAANVDSEVAHEAMQKFLDTPSGSEALYALSMFAVNGGAFGIAGDIIQGMNIGSVDMMERSIISGNIPMFSGPINLAMASMLVAGGIYNSDEDELERGEGMGLTAGGPVGGVIARQMGLKKGVKTPSTHRLEQLMGGEEDTGGSAR